MPRKKKKKKRIAQIHMCLEKAIECEYGVNENESKRNGEQERNGEQKREKESKERERERKRERCEHFRSKG